MNVKERKLFQLFPVSLVAMVLVSYSIFYVNKWFEADTIFVGDTLNSFATYSNHYSGLARGEYAMWNPLVRAGETGEVQQGTQLANPVSNMVAAACVLMGIEDVVFSYSLFILVLVISYATGVYQLTTCWTGNSYAGALACILAMGSSTVFFGPYHISYIQILHAVPWMLYAATMYVRKYEFRKLVIFVLAYNSAFYAYQFVMPFAYMIMLSVAAMVVYGRQVSNGLLGLRRIPLWHILVGGSILLVMTCPNVLMFMSSGEKLLISRISDISITDNYSLTWKEAFSRGSGSIVFSGKFWVTMFSGIFAASPGGELRHYVGPVALPLVVVALLSRRKAAWAVAMSGLLISMLAAGLFPAKLLYELPVISLIRNSRFLFQFTILSIIIVAGFGFDYLMRRESRRVLGAVCASMILASLIMLLFERDTSAHNIAVLLILISSMLALLLAVNRMPVKWFAVTSLGGAAAVMLGMTFLVERQALTGSMNVSPELMALRQRSDHALQFRFERPLDIDKIRMPSVYASSLGSDEYASLITLKDNSFRTVGGHYGLSSFPLRKSYFLFTSLPGHEEVMRRKFLFFSKCYTSRESSDMMEFMRDPNLLQGMVERGIGMADQISGSDVSLGPFRSRGNAGIPGVAERSEPDVDVRRYYANSVLLNVLVDKSGVLTYTDLWDRGWSVKVDGEDAPLVKVFHTFKGVELSPGKHEIEFLYRDKLAVFIVVMNGVFVLCFLGLILHLLACAWHNRSASRGMS